MKIHESTSIDGWTTRIYVYFAKLTGDRDYHEKWTVGGRSYQRDRNVYGPIVIEKIRSKDHEQRTD